MTTPQPVQPPPQFRIGAGTAIKIGFFGAFGALLFSLIIWLILGAIGLILAALGYLGFIQKLIPGF